MGYFSSEFGHICCIKEGFLSKINNRMANSVDPDETAHYEPSHLGLHCLQRYLYWSCRDERVKYDRTYQGKVFDDNSG